MPNNWTWARLKNFRKYIVWLLKDFDIVFARTVATVGKSFLIKNSPNNTVYASYLIQIRIIKILAEYLIKFFNSPFYWQQIYQKSARVGQPNVNGSNLAYARIHQLGGMSVKTGLLKSLQDLI